MRLLAGIVFAVGIGGATALASTPIAGATVGPTINPTLSVSPTSGPVGSVVTVTFGPSDDGCGGVGFGSSAVPTGAFLPLLDRGSQHFVIPATIGGPAPAPFASVSPGDYQFNLACDTSNNPATLRTVSVPFTVIPPLPPHFVGIASTPDGKGYWLAQSNGGVYSYGDAAFYGSLPGLGISPVSEVTGIAATKDGHGYWLVGADGGVFAFGDAAFYGSEAEATQLPPGATRSP